MPRKVAYGGYGSAGAVGLVAGLEQHFAAISDLFAPCFRGGICADDHSETGRNHARTVREHAAQREIDRN